MRSARRWTVVLLAAMISVISFVGLVTTASAAPVSPHPASATPMIPTPTNPIPMIPTPTDYVNECAVAPAPGQYTCYALRRNNLRPHAAGATAGGYGPADLRSAYALPTLTGAAPTVYVIDAYGYPAAEADLARYRAQYGLPVCSTANGCFRKLNQNGGTPTATSPAYHAGWAAESALDMDMVSAVCPTCHITLIESDDDRDNLFVAVARATTLGAKYVSMSWGGPETGDEATYDSIYLGRPGVVYAASSGDYGYADGVSYPSTSPNVVAVGGTSLNRSADARGWSERVWSVNSNDGTGSGCSSDGAKPAWQRIIAPSVCTRRAGNDVAAVADPDTGVSVYFAGSWRVYGGTSAAAPIIASVYALAGAPGPADRPGSYPYAGSGALNDVVTGQNGTCSPGPLCTAGTGWDGPTGLGTPHGVAAFRKPTHVVGATNPDAQFSSIDNPVALAIRASEAPAAGALTFTAAGLPGGLTINASGVVSGTPTTVGTTSVTVTATDTTNDVSSSVSFRWAVARAGTFVPLRASRILDTRSGNGSAIGRVGTNREIVLQVTGRGGVPSVGVSSVVLNVTATEPVAPGYITLHADGTRRPPASNLDYSNFTVPNLVVVPVGANGRVRLYASAATHLIADVSGYYYGGTPRDSGTFVPLNPGRLLDTRTGNGAPKAPVASRSTLTVQIAGRGPVPANASAVVLNIAETGARSAGFVTVYPGGSRPLASNIDFSAGITVPNLVTVPVDAQGRIRVFVYGGGGMDVFADVLGYYTSGAPAVSGSFSALSPARLLDTRVGTGGTYGRMSSGDTVSLPAAGVGGVPAAGTVSAVVLNVHAVLPSAAGYVTAYADGAGMPSTSNLNYARNRSVANLVIVPVSSQGVIDLTVIGGTTDLVADVTGYYRR